MPSSEAILGGLTAIANEWRALAIAWHALLGALLVALLPGWRPSKRAAGYLLTLPFVSVSALALASGNPFNGVSFAALALLLAIAAGRLSIEPVRIASSPAIAGALLVAFAWCYPHFLVTDRWTTYAYAAPLGLLPCPTLAAAIGLTLLLGVSSSIVWSSTLVAAGLLYGLVGVFGLGVLLDSGLLAGTIVLADAMMRSSGGWRSVRANRDERLSTLRGDELIPQPIGVLTHAITIHGTRREVWPWLAQMGAGCRGGWYSYDWIDNRRRRSALRIVPELQQLHVGMIFPALPEATDGLTLLAFETERFLLIGWLSPDRTPIMTWAFVLEDGEHGSTRLVVRARAGPRYEVPGLPWWIAKRIVAMGHFVMQRRQLLGIAMRVERAYADGTFTRAA